MTSALTRLCGVSRMMRLAMKMVTTTGTVGLVYHVMERRVSANETGDEDDDDDWDCWAGLPRDELRQTTRPVITRSTSLNDRFHKRHTTWCITSHEYSIAYRVRVNVLRSHLGYLLTPSLMALFGKPYTTSCWWSLVTASLWHRFQNRPLSKLNTGGLRCAQCCR